MLHDPFSNLKTLDVAQYPSLVPDAPASPNIDRNTMIAKGRCLRSKVEKRRFQTHKNAIGAAAQIGTLPDRHETVHMILKANAFDCFSVLPAILELSGKPADAVLLCTLGINDRHIQAIDELATAKQITGVRMLASHYFSKADPKEWQHAVEVFERHGFPIKAVRSHCKIVAVKVDEEHYIAAGSGNLRSCRASENMDLTNSKELFEFYSEYADTLFDGETA